jgi:hypothetical protein
MRASSCSIWPRTWRRCAFGVAARDALLREVAKVARGGAAGGHELPPGTRSGVPSMLEGACGRRCRGVAREQCRRMGSRAGARAGAAPARRWDAGAGRPARPCTPRRMAVSDILQRACGACRACARPRRPRAASPSGGRGRGASRGGRDRPGRGEAPPRARRRRGNDPGPRRPPPRMRPPPPPRPPPATTAPRGLRDGRGNPCGRGGSAPWARPGGRG